MKNVLIMILCFLWFLTGYKIAAEKVYTVKIPIPMVRKVYDFTQDPEIMKIYANTYGYILLSPDDVRKREEEIEKEKAENRRAQAEEKVNYQIGKLEFWEAGYEEGFKKCKRK